MSTRQPKSELRWVASMFSRAIPETQTATVSEWARANVRLPGSARTERFDPDVTPWTREVIDRCADGVTRTLTFVKPIQSGGSAAGEVALCYFIANSTGGDIQYNWEDDEKSAERWDKRIKRILLACPSVVRRWPSDRHEAKRGMVMFPHCNLTVQGVHSESNLDSDSIRYQINEEIHNWEPGRLVKAYGRTTAFWNSFILNVSNAGQDGDQLHQAFTNGTQQHWEVKCPGCGKFHAMRTRAEKDQPGGLKYDSEGCKLQDGEYDYNKLAPTIRYEFPCCGRVVRDNPQERRQLSISGRYSEPRNPAAHVANRSYTYEAVSVDYIPWLLLIQEKHRALRALRYGDPEPWRRYLTERECRFWSPDERPLVGRLTVSEKLRKDREGLKDRALRAMTVDKQAGSAVRGETPHYWAVIRDWTDRGDSLLVWEGKVGTDEDLELLREKYGVEPRFVVVDSGDMTQEVYRLCARFGYNALKGEERGFYVHLIEMGGRTAKVRRIFSPIHMVDPHEGDHGGRAGMQQVPLILYSKQEIRNRLAMIRSSSALKWEVPGDVSDEYKRHMESEEQQEFKDYRTAQRQFKWVQVAKRNDLFVCECYQVLVATMAEVIGTNLPESTEEQEVSNG